MTAYRPRLVDAKRAMAKMHARLEASGVGSSCARVSIEGVLNDHAEREIRTKISQVWDRPEIALAINSPGGALRVGRAIARDLEDARKCGGARIVATAGPVVASAALLPFVAAGWRKARRDTQFVVHQASVDASGFNLKKMRGDALRKLAAKLDVDDGEHLKFLLSKIRLTDPMIADLRAGRDVRLDGRTAYLLNVVHELDQPVGFMDDLRRARAAMLTNAPAPIRAQLEARWRERDRAMIDRAVKLRRTA